MSLIRLQGIQKRFRNRLSTHEPTIALRLDELSIEEGESVALIGPSGCGKSTLMQFIAGIQRPDQGEVDVAGVRVNQLSPSGADRYRGRTIGYLFQELNLIGVLSALDNVMLGMRFGKSVPRIQWLCRAREMLDKVGLGHRRKHFPAEMSIGEQQRVAIARALVNDPPIILADEPTGSLDPATSTQIFNLLREMCQQGTHTLIMITHDMTLAGRMPRRFDCAHLIQESDHMQ